LSAAWQPHIINLIPVDPDDSILGVVAYQAPELICVVGEAATDAEMDEEVPIDESPIDKDIQIDKLTTKSDVYAYVMVALEVCLVFDIICKDGVFGPAS
jgi:hypothetical protein